MARRVPKSQPLVIRARDDKITIISDQLPGAKKEAGVDDIWSVQEILAVIEPHLVMLDLALPITVGANLIELLHETYPNVPVVTRIESSICEPRFFVVEPTDQGLIMRPMSQPPTATV
jgi:CheY-like chemotaxis protein